MAFFFFLCRIQYTFFSQVILSFFLFSFSNRYAWSSNGKTPTIYQFISILKLLLHSTGIGTVVDLLSDEHFFQVSISFAFERTRVSLRSVISTSHFSRLIYYVVMWAEFTCIELLTTKNLNEKTSEKICGRELRTKSEGKKTETVLTCRNIRVSVGNRNSSLRSLARSFGPIILHYISPPDSFAVNFWNIAADGVKRNCLNRGVR